MANKTVNIESSMPKETLQKVAELLEQMKDGKKQPKLNYEIEPIMFNKISKYLQENPGRFTDERNFVTRAIETLLYWETDPPTARVKMNERPPLIRQLAFVKAQGIPPKLIETMWDQHPNCYTENEKEVEKFLEENPEYAIIGKKIAEKNAAAMQTGKQALTAAAAQEKERMSQADFQKLRDSKDSIIKFIKDTDFKKVQSREKWTEIFYDGWPLLWNYYSRILPAKIAIMGIADIMNREQSDIIELDEINKAHIYDLAEELSEILRREEYKKDLKKQNKFSTGLPKPISPDEIQSDKEKQTQYNAVERYKDRIIGKPRKDRSSGKISFDGMLSALGLIRTFTDEKNNVYVTLTENGKEFCLHENPIINGEYTSALSSKESHFLVTKVLPERGLEYRLMQTAIITVDAHSKNKTAASITDELDIAFLNTIKKYLKSENEDEYIRADVNDLVIGKTEAIKMENVQLKAEDKKEKQTPVQAYRVATMGRLSELGVLIWTIEKDTSSSYEIADADIVKELLK
tara:strand:+ start:338 stop:1894 length:1557 start_codon:yes stop_codon:yes gene_type:complete